MTSVTYKHLIAGSVFHYQKRRESKDDDPHPVKTITFAGKKGGLGYYETSDPGEIAELDKLAKNPQVQLERVEGTVDVALAAPTETISKEQPPEIQQAVQEVQEQAAKTADPKLVSAQENLAAVIRQHKNA